MRRIEDGPRRIPSSREVFLELESKYGESYDAPMLEIAEAVRARRQLTDSELERVCRWKSPRALRLVQGNSADEVSEVTGWALTTKSERLRIGTLQLLRGVGWPMGSVILHWFHPDPYPILDIRAVWSLGHVEPNEYTFKFWWKYVLECRELSTTLSLPMRSVDRALWQYSKDNGGPGSAA